MNVSIQVRFPDEILSTVRAEKRPHIHMNKFMLSQIRFHGERLATHGTQVGLYPQMYLLVFDQMTAMREGLPAG